ncbi:hypothetical protein BDV96DRAFT_617349 [Lophiotrema nucula]|uniref:DUF1772-domain-containing protein n=1 Tax=Lophiotrema nucula TaxID=690887 RepID=A0A6A5YGV9_9PLEO|nr:hypothetical protein BDV96DRAFT_617349 [Lophiotrema nucula]
MASPSLPTDLPLRIARVIGLTAPAIYSSLTFAYSYMVTPPLITHAPERLLAKQWLQAYQYAATFVPPLILSGTLSNAYLAYTTPSSKLRILYASAAVLVWSIIPVTLLGFEPYVNGAGKWKVQQLLKDEGYYMPEKQGVMPSVYVHTAKPEARRWAEGVEMRDIARLWARLNAWRYRATALAVVLSGVGTCLW